MVDHEIDHHLEAEVPHFLEHRPKLLDIGPVVVGGEGRMESIGVFDRIEAPREARIEDWIQVQPVEPHFAGPPGMRNPSIGRTDESGEEVVDDRWWHPAPSTLRPMPPAEPTHHGGEPTSPPHLTEHLACIARLPTSVPSVQLSHWPLRRKPVRKVMMVRWASHARS